MGDIPSSNQSSDHTSSRTGLDALRLNHQNLMERELRSRYVNQLKVFHPRTGCLRSSEDLVLPLQKLPIQLSTTDRRARRVARKLERV
jgi:hypothetical protein